MKKIMFVAVLMVLSILALEAKESVLLPEGYKTSNWEQVLANKTLNLDTLWPQLDGSLAWWTGDFCIEYEATQLTPASQCSVTMIVHGVFSETGNASKQCSLFVWSDNAGSPGNVLFKTEYTAFVQNAGYLEYNQCPINPPIFVSGPFWVGNYEMTSGYPTSVVDSSCQSSKGRKTLGDPWEVDAADYLHIAVVNYDAGVEEKVTSPSVVTLKASPSLFSNNTSISYSVKGNDKNVQIGIYDITGNLVKELVNGKYNTGTYTTCWNGCDKTNKSLSSGIYFCSLTSGNQKIINKMILIK
ncbi:MAG: FlgD immunoglobulin-like domain containing protein [bacterium]